MSDFARLKARILKLAPGWVNLAVAKQKAGISIITTVADAEKVLKVLTKPRKITPPVPAHVRERYTEAHRLYVQRTTPEAYKDHGCPEVVFPKIYTSGGLTKYIVNYLTWMGMYGNRINTTGRQLPNGKWITGTTKKGTGDIVSCISGRMVFWEVKIGSDKPSERQLNQQQQVRASGGEYAFIKDAEQFLFIFDMLRYG